MNAAPESAAAGDCANRKAGMASGFVAVFFD